MSRRDRPDFPSPSTGEGGAHALAWEGEGRHRSHPSAHATKRARVLRRDQTEAEAKLWQALRAGRLAGFKFRRQVSLGGYFADLVCPACKLIIEVDGGQHTPEGDAIRTAYLASQGYRIVRYWNNEVLANIAGVAQAILAELQPSNPLPPTPEKGAGPSLPRRGGGEVTC